MKRQPIPLPRFSSRKVSCVHFLKFMYISLSSLQFTLLKPEKNYCKPNISKLVCFTFICFCRSGQEKVKVETKLLSCKVKATKYPVEDMNGFASGPLVHQQDPQYDKSFWAILHICLHLSFKYLIRYQEELR